MRRYVIGRVAGVVPLLLGISVMLFVILSIAPGDPVDFLLANNPDVTPGDIVRLKHLYGLDRPVYVRYGRWLAQVAHGDLGWSVNYKLPVRQMLAERLPMSLVLMSAGLAASILVAIPAGVYSALHQYSVFDYGATVGSFLGFSIPLFWLGLIMIYIFAVKLHVLPPGGVHAPDAGTGWAAALDFLRHLILPAAVIALYNMASLARYTRSSILEVSRQDYVRTARAKGLTQWRVLNRHVMRNGMIPIVTVLALTLPVLFGGAPVTETVFGWPGVGQLLIQSVIIGDYIVAVAIVMCIAVLVVGGNLAADVLYGILDPRVRYQ